MLVLSLGLGAIRGVRVRTGRLGSVFLLLVSWMRREENESYGFEIMSDVVEIDAARDTFK